MDNKLMKKSIINEKIDLINLNIDRIFLEFDIKNIIFNTRATKALNKANIFLLKDFIESYEKGYQTFKGIGYKSENKINKSLQIFYKQNKMAVYNALLNNSIKFIFDTNKKKRSYY